MTLCVYLAARFSRFDELNRYRAELEACGIAVTSRWLLGGHEWVGTPDEAIPLDRLARFAAEDLEDIDAADFLVCFTEPARTAPARGGDRDESNEDEEVWADVPDSSCGYRVSSWGRVTGANGDFVLGSHNRGYRYVKPNGKHSAPIHALVASAFLGPRPNGMEIDHVDGDRSNNAARNLEYVTHEENIRRAARRGSYSKHGEANSHAVLSAEQVHEIRLRWLLGERNKAALGRAYGVTDSAVHRIVTGRPWVDLDDGRRDVLAGYALGTRKPVICVGHGENVFYALPEVYRVATWDEALHVLLNAAATGTAIAGSEVRDAAAD